MSDAIIKKGTPILHHRKRKESEQKIEVAVFDPNFDNQPENRQKLIKSLNMI
jgi:hypothetical protein